jgi:iron complex transport system ATP-binding protein
MIEVRDLSAGYGAGDVIKGLSFKAERGESLCILGPNGCGKSTLLKSIARIIPCQGSVLLEGRETASLSRRELAKKVAVLGQTAQIYFPYTVRETVSLGRYAYSRGFLKTLSREDEEIIGDAIKTLDLWDIKDRMIDELSGGQLQRVFLAKTMVQNPELVLLDEPTNHLDLKNQMDLLLYLKGWIKENNKTLVGVFHDLNLVHHFGDSALILKDGRTAAWGKVEQVLEGETLQRVYGVDIRGFMLESLEKWERAQPSRGGAL